MQKRGIEFDREKKGEKYSLAKEGPSIEKQIVRLLGAVPSWIMEKSQARDANIAQPFFALRLFAQRASDLGFHFEF